jgi:Cu2+-exporting ATPase
VRVTGAGENSRVARMLRQVEESSARKAPVVLLADRLSGAFVAVVLLLAAGIYAYWLQRDPTRATDNAIALLIVTCPCALAMATPLAVTVALGRAAKAGIFIKGGHAIELLSRPGTLFLDKTGTLTEGHTSVVAWEGPEWVKPLVVALERESSHPIAEGFRRAWPFDPGGLPQVMRSEHVVGGGIVGTVEGREVVVGSAAFVARRAGAREPSGNADATLTPVLVAVDGRVVARAGLGDPLRSDAGAAVEALAARGWKISIVSGDATPVVRDAARRLGITPEACHGEMSPEGKLALVEAARRRGPVVMVGDGVNDAGAIAAASVGVGAHGGAEACLATADVYLTTPGLRALVQLADGSARTMRTIRRNIAFSLLYNVAGAALAITGLISPLIAAIMMPASSLTVILSSWRGRFTA